MSYSLFTLRRARFPLRINGERALLRVNRLYIVFPYNNRISTSFSAKLFAVHPQVEPTFGELYHGNEQNCAQDTVIIILASGEVSRTISNRCWPTKTLLPLIYLRGHPDISYSVIHFKPTVIAFRYEFPSFNSCLGFQQEV